MMADHELHMISYFCMPGDMNYHRGARYYDEAAEVIDQLSYVILLNF